MVIKLCKFSDYSLISLAFDDIGTFIFLLAMRYSSCLLPFHVIANKLNLKVSINKKVDAMGLQFPIFFNENLSYFHLYVMNLFYQKNKEKYLF